MSQRDQQPGPNGRTALSPLTREVIIENAHAFLEDPAVGDMSVRQLGDRLGVNPTAFYRHFRDKDELLLEIWDRVLNEQVRFVRSLPRTLNWRQALHAMAMSAWELSERHPSLSSRYFARVTGGPNERETIEWLLGTLAEAGFPPREAVQHYRLFVDGIVGACGSHAGVLALGPELAQKDESSWERIYGSLSGDRYPAIREHSAELAKVDTFMIYQDLVQSILDRIEASLRRT